MYTIFLTSYTKLNIFSYSYITFIVLLIKPLTMKNTFFINLLFLLSMCLFFSCATDENFIYEPSTKTTNTLNSTLSLQVSDKTFVGGYALSEDTDTMEFLSFSISFTKEGAIEVHDSEKIIQGTWWVTSENTLKGTYFLNESIKISFDGRLENISKDTQAIKASWTASGDIITSGTFLIQNN